METLTARVAGGLARKSSRRHFLKFATASSLGTGLFLTRTGISLGTITSCVGCAGGPCPDCASPAPTCDSIGRSCPQPTGCPSAGGGCPSGCTTTGEWFCCKNSCTVRCSECSCTEGCCHCFTTIWGQSCGGGQCPC
jgi:hypothetical protein